MTRQDFRKLVANGAILVALSVCLFFVSSPLSAWGSVFWGQGLKKSITRRVEKNQPLRFDKVRAAGKLIELKGSESREDFDADDDWMKGLAVTFKNTTEKNIVYFSMDLMFPETEAAGPVMVFPLIFGRRPKDANDRNHDTKLQPGEEMEIALTDDRYGKMRSFLKGRSFEKVNEVRLFLEKVIFDDDIMWSGGSLYRRDEKDPNNWLPIR